VAVKKNDVSQALDSSDDGDGGLLGWPLYNYNHLEFLGWGLTCSAAFYVLTGLMDSTFFMVWFPSSCSAVAIACGCYSSRHHFSVRAAEILLAVDVVG